MNYQKDENSQKNVVEIIENAKNNQKNEQKIDILDKNFANLTQKSNEQDITKTSSFGSQTSLDNTKNEKNTTNFSETLEENTQKAQYFLENLFKIANIDAKISKIDTEKAIILKIETEDKKIISSQGEIIRSLSILIKSMSKPTSNLCKKVVIDIGNYREKQQNIIIEKTKQAIEKCVTTAKPVSLCYMNSYERFVAHEIILNDGRVVGESFGKEPRRFVKIFIK